MAEKTVGPKEPKNKTQLYLFLIVGTIGILCMLLSVVDWNKHNIPGMRSPTFNIVTAAAGVLLIGISAFLAMRQQAGPTGAATTPDQARKMRIAALCLLAVIGILGMTVGYYFAGI